MSKIDLDSPEFYRYMLKGFHPQDSEQDWVEANLKAIELDSIAPIHDFMFKESRESRTPEVFHIMMTCDPIALYNEGVKANR